MFYFLKGKHFLFLFFFLLIILFWGFYLYSNFKENDFQNNKNLTLIKDKDSWETMINKYGAKKTYLEIKEQYRDDSMSIAHSALHLFGETLYFKEGLAAITICDESFSFACYHGVFIAAVQDKGVGIINDLSGACKNISSTSLNCYHGIGHGILEYMGHGKLYESLNLCKQLVIREENFACEDGVFMEYNFPAEREGDQLQVSRKEFSADNPENPCTSMPKEYSMACYYNLPLWWNSIFKNDFMKLDELCANVNEINKRQACYIGIGIIVPSFTDYDVSKSIQVCKSISQNNEKLVCVSAASLYTSYKDRGYSSKLCESVEQNQKEFCLDYSNLGNILYVQ